VRISARKEAEETDSGLARGGGRLGGGGAAVGAELVVGDFGEIGVLAAEEAVSAHAKVFDAADLEVEEVGVGQVIEEGGADDDVAAGSTGAAHDDGAGAAREGGESLDFHRAGGLAIDADVEGDGEEVGEVAGEGLGVVEDDGLRVFFAEDEGGGKLVKGEAPVEDEPGALVQDAEFLEGHDGVGLEGGRGEDGGEEEEGGDFHGSGCPAWVRGRGRERRELGAEFLTE